MREPKNRAATRGLANTARRGRGRAFLFGFVVCGAVTAVLCAGLWYRYAGGHRRGARVVEAASLAEVIRPGAAAGFNVLLVTLDTVRQDRLGCYGYALAETPTCDALAGSGVVFKDAISSVPLTLPSHATLHTGLYPPRHGVRDNGLYRLSSEHSTLAITLKAHGYDTAAFVGCFVVDARFGLDQGFDVYDFEVAAEGYRPNQLDFNERRASAVTDAAMDWLRAREGAKAAAPFFMWVHYFDAHLPYTSPLGQEPRFAGRGYDAEISFADRNLGRLQAELERLGRWERTLVVVTADHGEALGEHEEPTHGLLLYSSTIRVPLILSCAALFPRPVLVPDEVIGLVDLRPTIEDLLGLGPSPDLDGRSLVRGDSDTGRAVYLETMSPLNMSGWSPLYAMRTRNSKYILAPDPEYYDLEADPGEKNNLYTSQPGAVATLSRELEQTMRGGSGGASRRELSDEEVARLGSLGYVQAPSPSATEMLPDPKAMMGVYKKSLAADELYSQQRFPEAAALAKEALAACAQCIEARRVLAFSHLKMGQVGEAVALLRAGILGKRDVFLTRSLAQALILSGNLPEAWDTLALYESSDPTDGRVPLLRGDIAVRMNRLAEAEDYYEAAIRLDENRVGIMARERIDRIRHGRVTSGRSPAKQPAADGP